MHLGVGSEGCLAGSTEEGRLEVIIPPSLSGGVKQFLFWIAHPYLPYEGNGLSAILGWMGNRQFGIDGIHLVSRPREAQRAQIP